MINNQKTIWKCSLASPLGSLLGWASPKGLIALSFWDDEEWVSTRIQQYYSDYSIDKVGFKNSKALLATQDWLKHYFEKKPNRLQLPPLDLNGTSFSIQVWKQLLKIPFGQTQSYGDIAKQLDRPQASRAVGRCVGTNPIGILIPCHRIIGANGDLTGFRGGLKRKRQLLLHEGIELG